ncbi:MAG: hypothetical protein CL927_13250 [Deltaproteobacteria bacterium]|nr:hypothetical protein [Deltaproteobacteria bacterium]
MTTPPLPPRASDAPERIESFVRAALHRDRTPGVVLAVCHPLRMYKVPPGLFAALEERGFEVRRVDTLPDRVASVRQIRDALLDATATEKPVDLLVFSGDGTLDHHVLVAAFWAFRPTLVHETTGTATVKAPSPDSLEAVPPRLREAFLDPLPDATALPGLHESTVHRFWVQRSRIRSRVLRNHHPRRIARAAGLPESSPLLRLLVFAVLFPDCVALQAPGFDLSGLAESPHDDTAQGLYPYLRSIAAYPAGTAADNALYAGIPGYIYAQFSKLLNRPALHALRRRWAQKATNRFVKVFTEGVVVPARYSLVAFDNQWSMVSSHAAGGPGGGAFFAADLEAKTGGLWGYLRRIPRVFFEEAVFGSTVLRVTTTSAEGRELQRSEGRMVEALYTNRAFIAGVGGVPSTNPSALAGQSSLILVPPVLYRGRSGRLLFDLSGLASFIEAIIKGLAGRAMHALGLGVGNLAGGGSFWSASPANQITLQEGQSVQLDFYGTDGRRRAVATQVSGDPYQCWTMQMRVAWGPLPLLAAPGSLLMAAAQRALKRLRITRTWQLETVYIAGLAWLRHKVVARPDAIEEGGLCMPPWTLPTRLTAAQKELRRQWETQGVGSFIDTTEQGLAPGRQGRYAHNSDHTAHLMVLRDRGGLLVRQVRRMGERIYEARTHYSRWPLGWVIHENSVRCTAPGEPPALLLEEHYFRNADALREEAPAFFPMVGEGQVWSTLATSPGGRAELDLEDDDLLTEEVVRDAPTS